MDNHNINTEGDIPCNCPACQIMNHNANNHFNELAKREGLSEAEIRIMQNEIETFTGLNLS